MFFVKTISSFFFLSSSSLLLLLLVVSESQSQSSNELWQTERPSDMARISSLEVMCGKEHMEVSLSFDKPFNGLVFSKGAVDTYECIYVKPQSASSSYQFNIYYDRCATKPDLNGRFYENNIVVQYDQDLIEVWDEAKRLRCEWYNDYERGVTKPPIRVADLDVIELNFRGDNVDCWMEIQQGKGPWASPVQGIVPLGTTLTMVVGIDDKQGEFDMRVKSCEASDNRNRPIALTDADGCVLRPKMISSFMKMKSADVSRATVVTYAFFHAFKFPDTMAVQIRCKVEICRYGCPEHCQRTSAATTGTYQRELSVQSVEQRVDNSGLKREIEDNEATDNEATDKEATDVRKNNLETNNKANSEEKERVPIVRPHIVRPKVRKPPLRLQNGGKRRLRPSANAQQRRRPDVPRRPGGRQRGQPQSRRPGHRRFRHKRQETRRRRMKAGNRRNEEENDSVAEEVFNTDSVAQTDSVARMSTFAKRRQRVDDGEDEDGGAGLLTNLAGLLPKPPRLPSLLPTFRLPSIFGGSSAETERTRPESAAPKSAAPKSAPPKRLPSAVPVSRTSSKSAQPLVFRGSSSTAALAARPIEAAPLHTTFPYGPRALNLDEIVVVNTNDEDNHDESRRRRRRRRRSAKSDVGVQSSYEVVSQVDLAFDPDQQHSEVAVLRGRMYESEEVVYGVCLPVTSFSLLFVLVSLLTVVSVLVSGFVCYQRQLTKADKEAAPTSLKRVYLAKEKSKNDLVYAAWFDSSNKSNQTVY